MPYLTLLKLINKESLLVITQTGSWCEL